MKHKINWPLRFQNKYTLVSLVTITITFVYQVFGILGIVPAISEDQVTNIAVMIIDVLAIVGIVVDPTTDGLGDSIRALNRKHISESRESR